MRWTEKATQFIRHLWVSEFGCLVIILVIGCFIWMSSKSIAPSISTEAYIMADGSPYHTRQDCPLFQSAIERSRGKLVFRKVPLMDAINQRLKKCDHCDREDSNTDSTGLTI